MTADDAMREAEEILNDEFLDGEFTGSNETIVTLAAEVTRLREREEHLVHGCAKLSYAIDEIDCLLLPPETQLADTEAVGGPVSLYSVDQDETAVVERVKKELERLRTAHERVLGLCGGFDDNIKRLRNEFNIFQDTITKLRAENQQLTMQIVPLGIAVDRETDRCLSIAEGFCPDGNDDCDCIASMIAAKIREGAKP